MLYCICTLYKHNLSTAYYILCNECTIDSTVSPFLFCIAVSCKTILSDRGKQWMAMRALGEWPTQITMLPIRQQTNTSDSAIQIPVQYQFSWFSCNTKSPCCTTSVTITVCNTGWVEYCIVQYSRLAHSHPSPATFILGRPDCLDIWMTREKGEGEAISVVRVGGKGVGGQRGGG